MLKCKVYFFVFLRGLRGFLFCRQNNTLTLMCQLGSLRSASIFGYTESAPAGRLNADGIPCREVGMEFIRHFDCLVVMN